jgi:hypothetical protein
MSATAIAQSAFAAYRLMRVKTMFTQACLADDVQIKAGEVKALDTSIRSEFFTPEKLAALGLTDDEISFVLGMLEGVNQLTKEGLTLPGDWSYVFRPLLNHRRAMQRKEMIESHGIEVQLFIADGTKNPMDPAHHGALPGETIDAAILRRLQKRLVDTIRATIESSQRVDVEYPEESRFG